MHKSTLFLIAVLALIAGLLGYNYFAQPFANRFVAQTEPTIPEEDEVVEPIDPVTKAFQALSPEEKIAQLMLVPVDVNDVYVATQSGEVAMASESAGIAESVQVSTASASSNALTQQWITMFKPGGVTLFGSNLDKEAVQSVVAGIREVASDAIIAVDHEGGVTQRFTGEGFTRLPSWQLQCQTELGLLEPEWRVSARELQEVGVTMVLAPVVDFATSHPVLGTRICSGDPEQVVAYATAWYETLADFGLQPVFKHFPGLGATTVDLHTSFESVTIGAQEAALYEALIATVKDMESAPTLAVMASHVGVSNQFAEIPCSLSEACLQELKSIAPDVLIVSDALEMKSTMGEDRTLTDVTRLAIRAGNHVLVYGPGVDQKALEETKASLGSLYDASPTFRASVDQAVTRVLTYKYSKME